MALAAYSVRQCLSKLGIALAAPSVDLRSSSDATRQCSNKLGIALAAPSVHGDRAALKKMGVLIRVGSDKTGCWMIARKVMTTSR